MREQSKILIVDDTPVVLEVMEDLLATEGYELLFAQNGLTAVETAVAETPDLVLLDIMMPKLDGFGVCRRLREIPLTAKIPIIMITALSDRRSRLKGIEAGADDFLTKPINSQEFLLRVKTITRLNRYRQLLTEQQKFKYLVTHDQIGHLILDTQGQILFANLQAQRYLSTPLDETTPPEERHFQTLVQQTYRQEPAAAWENWPEPPPDDVSRYLIRPETKWLKAQWLNVAALSYETDMGANWLITLTDVSQQIGEVQDIRNFQKLVSHKLRTPVVGLENSLEIISRQGSDFFPEQLSESIAAAQRNVHHLAEKIEDVLKYVNVSALARDTDGFSLSQLSGMVKRLALNIGLDAMAIHLQQSEASREWRLAISEHMLEMILYELLENAYKFHPDKTPIVEIAVRQDEPFIILTVSDNGRSLSLEQLSQVWVPYYQVEKAFTGEVPGMGLGLSTVASMVWQANGHYRMYNRTDQTGVTVEIKLPMHAVKQ